MMTEPDTPTEMQGRWRLRSLDIRKTDNRMVAHIALTDGSNDMRWAEGHGDTAMEAILDGLFVATGYVCELKDAQVFAASNAQGQKAQAHIILVNEAGD